MITSKSLALALAACATLCIAAGARAGDRILGTWGVTSLEGGAGGGLATWATIAGTGSDNQIGGHAGLTEVRTNGGYSLRIADAAVGVDNQLELSVAQWRFGLADTAPGQHVDLRVLGLKWRMSGDVLYDQDSWMPQLSAGAQFKKNENFALPHLLGARHDSDVEPYVSATKVWLGAAAGRNVLGDVTLRATRANQFGLLGFGGDKGDNDRLEPEASLAVMPADPLAVGVEWRRKPDLLSAFREASAYDVFAAWFPCRRVSLTAAWVHLGNVAAKPDQHSWYLSAQALF